MAPALAQCLPGQALSLTQQSSTVVLVSRGQYGAEVLNTLRVQGTLSHPTLTTPPCSHEPFLKAKLGRTWQRTMGLPGLIS